MERITLLILIMMSTVLLKSQSNTAIEYKKGACMGFCPVYTVSIDDNGLMYYNGVAHVERKGRWTRQLRKREFRVLKRKFKWSKINKLEDQYDQNVMDAAQTSVRFKYKDIDKSCSWKIETPKNLIKAEKYLLKLLDDQSSKEKWKDANEPALINPGRKEFTGKTLIIQFRNDVSIDQWIKKYPKYRLQMERQIAPKKPIYLFSFDESSISIENLIAELKNDALCEYIEINKPVKQRR